MQLFPITQQQRRDAQANPVRFFVREWFRFASTAALLSVFAAYFWPENSFNGRPGVLLYFVVGWSAGMSLLTTIEGRRGRGKQKAQVNEPSSVQ